MLKNRYSLLFFIVTTILGLIGNIYSIPMFFGVDQIFGSIFVLINTWMFGPIYGLVSGLIIHSYTILLWNHPYGFVSFVLEAFVVGLLLKRGVKNIFLADSIYWIFIGIPLVYPFYGLIMNMADTQVTLISLKQPANGLFNALIATLITTFIPLKRWANISDKKVLISFRELVLTIIMSFVFFSSFITAMVNSRNILQSSRDDIHRELLMFSNHIINEFEHLKEHIDKVDKDSDLSEFLRRQTFNVKYESYLILKDKVIGQNASHSFKSYSDIVDGRKKFVEDGIYNLLPIDENMPTMLKWKKSFYVLEKTLNKKRGLKLIVKIPFTPYIDKIQEMYIRIFIIMLGVTFIALLISIYVRATLIKSLNNLRVVTTNFPDKLLSNTIPSWPESSIEEINSLSKNFQSVAGILNIIFAESENRYNKLFESTTDAVFVIELKDKKIIDLNHQAEHLLGLKKRDILNKIFCSIFISNKGECKSFIEHTIHKESFEDKVLNLKIESGEIKPIEVNSLIIKVKNRDVALIIAKDISDKLSAEENLRLIAKVFESTTEGIIITDRDKKVVKVNRGFEEITGYSLSEVIEKTPSILKSTWQDKNFYEEMWKSMEENGEWQGEIWNRRKNGEIFAEWLSINCVYDKLGEITNYIGIFIDITEQKKAQEKINQLAFYDPLTKLPNRTLFKDRIKQAILKAKRSAQKIAIFFLDLDNFKTINDTLGHHTGDLLLQALTKEMLSLIRKSDTMARLGGDEFTFIFENVRDAEVVTFMAKKILNVTSKPFNISGHEIFITASIGICFYPDNGESLEELMSNADVAMYRAKESGKNNFAFFNFEMNKEAKERLEVENLLRKALQKDELRLYYQPQVDIKSGTVIGAEALLRWIHPIKGFISPEIFIPIAEDSGLIANIENWVINKASSQLKEWIDSGYKPIKMSINISDYQFRKPDFNEKIEKIIREVGVDFKLIDLELTERIIMNSDIAKAKLNKLKELGFRLSIDDFGTGYSSLSYLKWFNIDKLKIDKSFINDVPDDEQSCEIAQAIISLAHSLQMEVIAEGVETKEQLDFIDKYGGREYQGYFFSKPIPANEFEKFLVRVI